MSAHVRQAVAASRQTRAARGLGAQCDRPLRQRWCHGDRQAGWPPICARCEGVNWGTRAREGGRVPMAQHLRARATFRSRFSAYLAAVLSVSLPAIVPRVWVTGGSVSASSPRPAASGAVHVVGGRAGGQQQQQQCFAYTGVRRGPSTLLTSPASTPPSDPSSSPALPAASASSIRRSRAAHVSACPAGCSSAAASRGVKCCTLPPPHLAAPTTACCAASMQPASMHHDAGIQRASIQRAQQTSSALSRAGKHQSASALSL